MSYEFTTDPIDARSGEGAISEAIDAAVHGKTKKDPVDEETRAVLEVAKRAVLVLVPVLGPGVVTYTVNVSGNHATARTVGNIAIEVDAVDYDE